VCQAVQERWRPCVRRRLDLSSHNLMVIDTRDVRPFGSWLSQLESGHRHYPWYTRAHG